MTKAQANTNFHTSTKKTVFDSLKDERFLEYRRRWHEYPANFIVGDFPIHLDIENTNVCNLKCPYCATTTAAWGSSKKGMLTLPLYKRIIDEGADNGLYSIKLSLRGEPLLHKDLADMVAYAKKKGIIDIYFNTNAVLLTQDTSSRLIDAGLNRISISADGWNKKSFEKNRKGARFDIVYNNIILLRKIRSQKGVNFPKIRIQAVMLQEIREHWDEYLKLWEPLSDEIGYLDARKEGRGIDHKGLKANWACPFLWQRMTILWDGTILPCLMHGVEDLSLMALGNVKDVTIKELWSGKRNNFYRILHKEGKSHKIEACDKCSYRAMETEKLGAGE